jgi:hypothetical protein
MQVNRAIGFVKTDLYEQPDHEHDKTRLPKIVSDQHVAKQQRSGQCQ